MFFDSIEKEKTTGVSAVGSASALGAEGRWFESSTPDFSVAQP